MSPDETVVLARYVRALCPQQKFDEYTPDAWHDVLGGYPLAEARGAAAVVARRQPFVSPAEIITEVKRQRGERASGFQGPGLPAEVPDADPDDIRSYLLALRTQRTRAAEGRELKPRPVAALLGGVGREAPAKGPGEASAESVRRAGPLGIDCPVCQAPIGRPCRRGALGRERRHLHPQRVENARRAAAGLPLVDLAEVEAAGEARAEKVRAASRQALADYEARAAATPSDDSPRSAS